MAKFEFPKIELSDKQKKVAKAMLIALGILLLVLIVGVILQKGKDSRGTTPAATTDSNCNQWHRCVRWFS